MISNWEETVKLRKEESGRKLFYHHTIPSRSECAVSNIHIHIGSFVSAREEHRRLGGCVDGKERMGNGGEKEEERLNFGESWPRSQ
jgi:hypothetical protein